MYLSLPIVLMCCITVATQMIIVCIQHMVLDLIEKSKKKKKDSFFF